MISHTFDRRSRVEQPQRAPTLLCPPQPPQIVRQHAVAMPTNVECHSAGCVSECGSRIALDTNDELADLHRNRRRRRRRRQSLRLALDADTQRNWVDTVDWRRKSRHTRTLADSGRSNGLCGVFCVLGMLFLTIALIEGTSTIETIAANGNQLAEDMISPVADVRQPHQNVDHAASDDYHRRQHPIPDFHQPQRVRTRLTHARHKHAMPHTRQEDGSHADEITVEFAHRGGRIVADLRLNTDLLPQGHFLKYQTPGGHGHIVRQNFSRTNSEMCQYLGHIRGQPDSRVAMSTCSGLHGMIFDGHDTFYLAAVSDGHNGAHGDHILYRHADLKSKPNKCQHSHEPSSTDQQTANATDSIHETILRTKRSLSPADAAIRGPYNSNRQSSYVELVLVADNSVFKVHKTLNKVYEYCKQLTNIVNALYMPLNIFVALTGVVVWNEKDEIEIAFEGETTLRAFADYRRTKLVRQHPNDNAHLLTRKKFKDDVVGKAYKGEMCTYQTSVGIAQDHSPVVGVVATTIAHEMGHNFGMEHDEDKCTCAVKRCIMAAATSSEVTLHWSSCSIDQLNRAFHHGFNYCLRNKPTSLFGSPTCGNGFVERGEQCDCGEPQFCQNPCCDPATCMLRSNASCATGACCDLATCRPHTAGVVCRPADDGECDLPEFCTGESEYCPADYYRRDTDVCAGGRAYCYEGACRSHNDQCRTLWGPSGKSSPECYANNLKGSRHGNCGYDQLKQNYTECDKEDILCGSLQCRHLNERLEFGMESRALLAYSFVTSKESNTLIPCRTVTVDFGLETVDPGLTPNGAQCGTDRMCVDRRCRRLEALWQEGVGRTCAGNCSGHGVCDNTGGCHCEVGFGGPECNEPGPGGSQHSGPATNPNDGTGFVRAMYVFFLGVVPFVSLFLFFVYYWRQNRPAFLRKSANAFKSQTSHKSSPHRPPPNGGSGHNHSANIAIAIPASSPMSPTSSNTSGMPSTSHSTDDMSSALLRTTSTTNPSTDPSAAIGGGGGESSLLNNNMFGHFKGFSLKPLPQNSRPAGRVGATNIAYVQPVAKTEPNDDGGCGVPQRSAPPVPTAKSSATSGVGGGDAPALPPHNPGSTARPLISRPRLEASTCSAKELISPLRSHPPARQPHSIDQPVPSRSAPAPPIPPHGISHPAQSRPAPHNVATAAKPSSSSSSSSSKDIGAIRRIASFLMKDDKAAAYAVKPKPTIDRDQLRTLEISAPLSNVDLTSALSDGHHPHAVAAPAGDRTSNLSITRAQSMREPKSSVALHNKRINLPSFGSMRMPPSARPGSAVGGLGGSGLVSMRPKSPPPPRPPPLNVSNATPATKTPSTAQPFNVYDCCEADETPANVSPTDNIYAVIDELQRSSKPSASAAAETYASKPTSELGLLGEIAVEIENRNLDSIYSASTLGRQKLSKEVGSKMSAGGGGASNKPIMSTAPIARVAPVNKAVTSAAATPVAKTTTAPSPSICMPMRTMAGNNVGDTNKPHSFSSFRNRTFDGPKDADATTTTATTTKPPASTLAKEPLDGIKSTTVTPITSNASGASRNDYATPNTKSPFGRAKTPTAAAVLTSTPTATATVVRPKPTPSAKPQTVPNAKPTMPAAGANKPTVTKAKPPSVDAKTSLTGWQPTKAKPMTSSTADAATDPRKWSAMNSGGKLTATGGRTGNGGNVIASLQKKYEIGGKTTSAAKSVVGPPRK